MHVTLIKHFGSVKRLRAAHLDDIADVPGIGPKTALAIKLVLDEQPAGEAINTATGEIMEG